MSEKDKDEQIKDLKQSNEILSNNLNKIKDLHNEKVLSQPIEYSCMSSLRLIIFAGLPP